MTLPEYTAVTSSKNEMDDNEEMRKMLKLRMIKKGSSIKQDEVAMGDGDEQKTLEERQMAKCGNGKCKKGESIKSSLVEQERWSERG